MNKFVLLGFITICILSTIKPCVSKRNNEIYCGACMALIDEMNHEISLVDPKKRIEVGSFRIDPQGNQKLHEVPLARSAVHLTELLENVCTQMTNYGRSTNAEGRNVYTRYSTRDGSSISMSNMEISGGIQDKLQFACETVVEDSEEELVPSFQVGLDNFYQTICVDLLEICNARNITDFEETKLKQKTTQLPTTTDETTAPPSDDSDETTPTEEL